MSAKKSPPFTETEKTILVGEVSNFKNVVERKKCDVTSKVSKTSAWQKIADNFNAHEGVSYRNVEQLKRCWEKLKSISKTALTAESRYRMETRDGYTYDSKVRADVLAIAPYIAEKMQNKFDSAHSLKLASAAPASSATSAADDATSNSSVACGNIIATVISDNSNSNSSCNIKTAAAVDSNIEITEPVANSNATTSPDPEIENPVNVMTPTTNRRRRKSTIFDPEISKRIKKLDEGIKQQEEMHIVKMQNERELHDLKTKILEKQLRIEELKEKILLKELEVAKK
ncbi:Uncharacterized protein GBIM_17057 [Gryllus bimaculatus]|nr:Uncharacterized protein GBIM_17057 [Gryllus bimaculatus]